MALCNLREDSNSLERFQQQTVCLRARSLAQKERFDVNLEEILQWKAFWTDDERRCNLPISHVLNIYFTKIKNIFYKIDKR